MTECVTQGIVLGTRGIKEQDRIVDIYTKDCGRLEVKVISGKRMLSKLSSHLDVMTLGTVRIASKTQFVITDALLEDRFEEARRSKVYARNLDLLLLVRSCVPFGIKDEQVWQLLIKHLKQSVSDFRMILQVFGYDPEHASCFRCKKKTGDYFLIKDHIFVCAVCATKIPEDKIVKTS